MPLAGKGRALCNSHLFAPTMQDGIGSPRLFGDDDATLAARFQEEHGFLLKFRCERSLWLMHNRLPPYWLVGYHLSLRSLHETGSSQDLTDEQWAVVGPLIPEPPRRADGRGRPRKPSREVLNGVLWHDLPARYPPYQTCHRRFKHGCATASSSRCYRR